MFDDHISRCNTTMPRDTTICLHMRQRQR